MQNSSPRSARSVRWLAPAGLFVFAASVYLTRLLLGLLPVSDVPGSEVQQVGFMAYLLLPLAVVFGLVALLTVVGMVFRVGGELLRSRR